MKGGLSIKALVIGCAGFIGSNLVDKLLERGYQVTGIDCFNSSYSKKIKETNISHALKNKNFKFIGKDILNIKKFPSVDYVFHLAAQAGVRASWGKSFEIYTKNNIEATQVLLEFYKESKIKKFVYASSSSVYGGGGQTRDFTYVDDTVRGTILAAGGEVSGETFNVGGGSRISVNDALKSLQELMAMEAEIEYLDVQKGDVGHTYADISKAKNILGYEPEVGLKEGLKRQVEWIGEIYPGKTK